MKHTSNSKAKRSPVSAGLMPTEASGNYSPKPPYVNMRQRSITASHSSPYDMLAIISSRYQYSPFLFFVAEVMSNYLTTDGLKNFIFYFRRPPLRPEARGICHHCHMVNPAQSPVVVVVRVNCIDCKVQSTADVFEMMCRVSSRPLNPTRSHTWQRC